MRTAGFLLGIMLSQVTMAQIPVLQVQNTDSSQYLALSELKIHIDVVGNIATTTFDMVFYNPNPRVLEGELTVPLNEGQEVCRYALDINGRLREGVIVEKLKGRQTFEAIERRGIDPGLAHLTKGNNFKTRIYPVPAEGTKRVVIGISETLSGDDQYLYYHIPVSKTGIISNFQLEVNVFREPSEDKIPVPEFGNISFEGQDNIYRLTMTKKDYAIADGLQFAIPRFADTDHQLFTSRFNGKTYFYLTFKAPELTKTFKPVPDKIDIYWDRSFSAQKKDIDEELSLLSNYLTSLDGTKKVSVRFFNYKVEEPKIFIIDKDPSQLISYLRSVKNEGATSLNTIQLNKDCDEILFFSDAINTIGTAEIKLPDIQVYMITSSPGSNYSFMKRVARNTNGEYINLGSISQERALQLLLSNEEKYLSCSYDPSELTEVYPNTSRQTGKYFEITGILKDQPADLTVNFGNQGGITKRRIFNIGEGIQAPVERIWAGKKIESLSMDPDRNKKQILDLSKTFTIITKNTALMVLDRIEDYVQYEIVPPDEMKKEYFALLANKKKLVQSDTVSVHKLNSERSKQLFDWYENPILKRQSANTSDALLGEEEEMYEVFDQESEEIVPLTRQEERPPPPPPPESDAVFYMANEDMEMEDAAFQENVNVESPNQSSIKVLGWLPEAPYMEELRNAGNSEIEAIYYRFKKLNLNRPSFYIQVSDLYFERGMKKEAVRILSNILEMDLENPELLKIVARRLLEEGEIGMATEIFKEVKTLRPEEPQSFRDLAIAYFLAQRYQDALDMYAIILNNKWDRFENIKDIVINEMNSLVELHGDQLDLTNIDSGLINAMPLDIRIVVDWSTNDNDIDLWVIDPNGEKCFYKHQYTVLGGKLSKDFTRGYGPEEFSLKNAKRGIYTVYVNYFGDTRQQIAGPVTVYAKLYTHYGTPEQSEKSITIQLKDNKETRQIGQLEFYKE